MPNKQLKNGVTLMEIIIVTIVLGGLAAVSLPRYTTGLEKSRSGEGVQLLTALLNAQKALQQSTGAYAGAGELNKLEITINTPKYFNTPTISANTASLASIQSISGGYTLSINQDGIISCNPSGGTCQKMGY